MHPIRILQWNILGLRPNLATLLAANAESNYDLFVLQETLLLVNSACNIKHYTAFHLHHIPGWNRGLHLR